MAKLLLRSNLAALIIFTACAGGKTASSKISTAAAGCEKFRGCFNAGYAERSPEAQARLYTRAVGAWEKADGERELAAAYANRGIAWYRQGKYDDSIADFTKAVELDPEYAFGYYGRGAGS